MLVVVLGAQVLGAGVAHAAPSGVTLNTTLELKADGSLAVKSVITAPTGKSVTQLLPLSVPVEGNRTQHFTVTDTKAENGSAAVVDDALRLTGPGGTTTVTFTVRGTVANGPELQQFTWPLVAGFSTDIDTVTMRFASPTPAPDSPLCGIGQVGERRLCTLTQTDAAGVVTAQQNGLPQGKVAVFTTLLPAGTVPADARFTPAVSPTSATTGTGGLIALSVATVLALALAGYAFLRRRADTDAATSVGPTAELVVRSADGVAFASPDGVLPGQVGTVLAGRVQAADVGATVLDLAVRGYLWIAALPAGDFQISRRVPLDGAITASERAVVEAILPGDKPSTTLTELAGGARPVDIAPVRAATVDGVADRGWLRKRPAAIRRRRTLLAFGVAGVGALVALVLAFTGGGWAYGVAVTILGIGLIAASLLLPDRTVAGSRLAAGVNGMRQYLVSTNVGALRPDEGAMLFERGIPYAHALGELRGWLGTWGATVSAPLDWYRSTQSPVVGLATLAAALDGVAAQSEAASRT